MFAMFNTFHFFGIFPFLNKFYFASLTITTRKNRISVSFFHSLLVASKHNEHELKVDLKNVHMKNTNNKIKALDHLRTQVRFSPTSARFSTVEKLNCDFVRVSGAATKQFSDEKHKIQRKMLASILTSSFVNEETIKTVECYWKRTKIREKGERETIPVC